MLLLFRVPLIDCLTLFCVLSYSLSKTPKKCYLIFFLSISTLTLTENTSNYEWILGVFEIEWPDNARCDLTHSMHSVSRFKWVYCFKTDIIIIIIITNNINIKRLAMDSGSHFKCILICWLHAALTIHFHSSLHFIGKLNKIDVAA